MKNINLTNEEKKKIVDKLDGFYNDETTLNTLSAVMMSAFGVVGSLVCLTIGLVHDPLAFKGLFLALGTGAITPIITGICKRFIFRKTVTKKLSYGQFREMEKSGEIARWRDEYSAQSAKIEIMEYASKETNLNNNQQVFQKDSNNIIQNKELQR